MLGLRETIKSHQQIRIHFTGCNKVILFIMSIAQISIGAVYLHECPRQHYIPIYLIVVGVFGLMLMLLSLLPCAKQPKEKQEGTGSTNPLTVAFMAWKSLTSLFLFCWFIAGNVWIYSIYQPNYNKNTTDVGSYCNKTVYLFAFWTITLFYIPLCLFLVIGFCFTLWFSFIFHKMSQAFPEPGSGN